MPFSSVSNPKPVFLDYFEEVDDPRQAAKVLYPFEEILLLVLCAVISGADNWTSIALYGQKKLDVLRRFLPFEGVRRAMISWESCFPGWIWSNFSSVL